MPSAVRLAFHVMDDIGSLDGGTPFRELLDVDIREISVGVVFPAYPGTQLAVHQHGQVPMQSRGGLSINFAEEQLAMSGLR
jgi:phage head maturation protease